MLTRDDRRGDFAIAFVMRASASSDVTFWSKGQWSSSNLALTYGQTIAVRTPSASAVAALPASGFHVYTVRGAALEMRVDGMSTTGSTNTTDLSQPGGALNLGPLTGGSGVVANLECLELVAYKGTVSETQIQGLETYFKEKYGL